MNTFTNPTMPFSQFTQFPFTPWSHNNTLNQYGWNQPYGFNPYMPGAFSNPYTPYGYNTPWSTPLNWTQGSPIGFQPQTIPFGWNLIAPSIQTKVKKGEQTPEIQGCVAYPVPYNGFGPFVFVAPQNPLEMAQVA